MITNNLVSIIVPVYGVEKELPRCLDSILCQTYPTMEILLIDDGSPDNCGRICDTYAKKDPRIRVIHKENGGLSDARNAALDVCTGEYVTFVDSDDYIAPEYVEFLHHMMVVNNADLSICEYVYETDKHVIINHFSDDGSIKIFSTEDALKELCIERLFSCSACAKMYKADSFRHVRFPKGGLFEDVATTYKLFMKAERVALGKRALYFYMIREGSITHSPFTMKNLDSVRFGEEMCGAISAKYPELSLVTDRRLFVQYVYALRHLELNGQALENNRQIAWGLYEKFCVTRQSAWKCGISFKMKCYVICSLFGLRMLNLGFRIESFLSMKRSRK